MGIWEVVKQPLQDSGCDMGWDFHSAFCEGDGTGVQIHHWPIIGVQIRSTGYKSTTHPTQDSKSTAQMSTSTAQVSKSTIPCWPQEFSGAVVCEQTSVEPQSTAVLMESHQKIQSLNENRGNGFLCPLGWEAGFPWALPGDTMQGQRAEPGKGSLWHTGLWQLCHHSSQSRRFGCFKESFPNLSKLQKSKNRASHYSHC